MAEEKPQHFCVLSDEDFDRLTPDERTHYLKRATTAVALLVAQLKRMFAEEELH